MTLPGTWRRGRVLCVITDEQLQDRWRHDEIARMAARGGADMVQLREKRPRTTADLLALAERAMRALDGTAARLVVNDRVDVALACGARAAHLGAADLPPEAARAILGEDALIGGTANSAAEAARLARRPVDYLGVGPVFGTASKREPAPPLGLATLGEIARAVDKPVIAIGNITVERVHDVLAAGAWGVAVLSAVSCREDPEAAARRFRAELDGWREPAP